MLLKALFAATLCADPAAAATTEPPSTVAPAAPSEDPAEPGSPSTLPAAEPAASSEYDELSLEELLGMEVGVASVVEKPVNEAPGIVTVVHRQDIEQSGARSLQDILLMVPGFMPALDTQGVVGIGTRGVWGHEGKILVLVDGHEMQELLYSTFALREHIPADLIERVEIIRGPGSAIYGGNAELGVVNVVLRGADDFQGGRVSAQGGKMSEAWGQRAAALQLATKLLGDALSLSFSGALGDGPLSQRTYRGLDFTTADLSDDSGARPRLARLEAKYKGARVSLMLDDYSIDTTDGLGTVIPPVREGFRSYFAEGSYALELADNAKLTTRVSFKHQTPWQVLDDASDIFYDKTVTRLRGNLTLTVAPVEWLDLLGGVEAHRDEGRLNDPREIGFNGYFQLGDVNSRGVDYNTVAAFAQAIASHEIANLTLGARYERHDEAGDAFVPRVALTRVIGPAWIKALYSKAFRAPGIENFSLAIDDISPERTTVIEAELGSKLGDHAVASVNFFDITLEDPIIYFYDENGEGYVNATRTGSRGVEAQASLELPALNGTKATAGYSFYDARGKNEVASYVVPGREAVLLGMSTHKATLAANVPLPMGLAFGSTAVFVSKRFALRPDAATPDGTVRPLGATVLVGAHLRARDVGVAGLEAQLAVHNLFDQAFSYPQPYGSGHAPVPGASREVSLKLAYDLPM